MNIILSSVKKVISFLFTYIVLSNIWVGLCAVSLILATKILSGTALILRPYQFLIFFSTVAAYSIHRGIALFIELDMVPSAANSWIQKNRQLFGITFVIALLGVLVFLFIASWVVKLIVLPLAVITLAYLLPLFKIRGKSIRLRDLTGMKIFFISIVWGTVTVWIPLLRAGVSLFSFDSIAMLLERVLFVFAITIPFDIRDIEHDTEARVKTLPIMFGEKRAKMLALLMMLCFVVLCYFHYSHRMFIPLLLSAVVAGILIYKTQPKRNYAYYLFFLDGTMFLQGVLLLLMA